MIRIAQTLQTTPNDLLGLVHSSVDAGVGEQLKQLLEIASAMQPDDLRLLIVQAKAVVAARAAEPL
ncbi:hypothetical protein [Rhizobium laguerreae]|uniref:hypothetical protein n=1 Tax=Rhizobium laguerreae TaxID=1076926 RepID=UPI001FE6AD01